MKCSVADCNRAASFSYRFVKGVEAQYCKIHDGMFQTIQNTVYLPIIHRQDLTDFGK